MRAGRLICLSACLLLSMAGLASAVEPYNEFVAALRERQYYDTALEYLEWMEQQPQLPAELRALIPYEKADTLMQWARVQRNPEKAHEYLDRAKSFLEQFLKESPQHPRAPEANTELAQVLVGKGKVAVIQSRSPGNAGKKAEFQKTARDYFAQARAVFQKAHDLQETAWKAFPVFIDKVKEPERFEARAKAEQAYLQAQLNLAIVTYELAQAHDTESPEYRKTLAQAAKDFQLIHSKYRSQVAGLYAKMYQGKCFEEQGDLQKALGVYNELLSHNPESEAMRKLQDQVTQYRLICLNNPKRKDYQLVIQEAETWLKNNPGKVRTRLGTAIRWELARAQESLGRAETTPQDQRQRLLQQALANARTVNKIPGEYRDPSQALIQQVMLALNREPGDPKDFDTAYGLARDGVQKVPLLKDAAAAGKTPEEQARLAQDLKLHLGETARMLNLTLALAEPDTPRKDVNRARYMLAYVNLMLERNYDAAVIGEYIARRYATDEDSGNTPLEAAYLAMAAYSQAYNAPQNKHKELDIEWMIGICNFITTTWPQSDKAVEARMMLGRMYSQIHRPVDAATWFTQIPETSPQYLEAQLAAGQAYWAAYADAAEQPAETRPAPEKLTEYQQKAREMLLSGVAKSEAKLADTEALPVRLTYAKLTLAQMENASGNYAAAVQLLETGKRPVIGSPHFKEDQRIASEAYRQLLRSYIGTQNLESAKKTMTELERIETSAGRDVTPLYVALGQQFKEELDRLAKTDKQQHEVVLKSFETFLQNMLARADGQTFNSLAWIGETYLALAEGVPDKTQAAPYFTQAAKAFNDILERADQDASFANPQQRAAIKFRLVTCKRRAGEFEDALALIKDLLKNRSNALDVQREAALLYQDWAASGPADAAKYWKLAIAGSQSSQAGGAVIWGWGEIGNRLAGQLDAGSRNPEYQQQLRDARYNIAFCRHKSAFAQSTDQKRLQQFELAEQDIGYTVALLNLDDEWYKKFNELYRENQKAMGKAEIVDLERTQPRPAVAAARDTQPGTPKTTKRKGKSAAKVAASSPAAPASGGGDALWLIGIVVMGAVVVGGVAFMNMRPKKRRPASTTASAPSIPAAAPPGARPRTRAKP